MKKDAKMKNNFDAIMHSINKNRKDWVVNDYL